MIDDLEKARKAQRMVNLYHRVFASEDGKAVLDDLKECFGFGWPAFMPLSGGDNAGVHYDPIHAAIRDGQRQVILHVESKMAEEALGDGDISQPKATVETE